MHPDRPSRTVAERIASAATGWRRIAGLLRPRGLDALCVLDDHLLRDIGLVRGACKAPGISGLNWETLSLRSTD
jgi:uncharacterized protein YjiS (DUF1127 family)